MVKPLGHKSYGSIGHLPSSRLGPGDHHVHPGQARICTEKARDRHDRIIVQEKLDGSNCAVARIDGQIMALGRAGYLAQTSKYEQHQLFAVWVREREKVFRRMLEDGERIVGEWLAQAHGTVYDTTHPGFAPFVAFDLMCGRDRVTFDELCYRVVQHLMLPWVISDGPPLSIANLGAMVDASGHGADVVEGAVYRVERRGRVDFLAKWVRPEKVDGKYLPEVSGGDPIWHWRPSREAVA